MEDLIGIIALNHQVLFENFSLSLRKNKLLFTSLGRSVLGKTVHSVLSTGAQDLGHSLTQWITYLSLSRSRNKQTHPPPPHHAKNKNNSIFMLKTTCIHSLASVNTPCNLWQGKIPLAKLLQSQRARQKLWKAQFRSLSCQRQAK